MKEDAKEFEKEKKIKKELFDLGRIFRYLPISEELIHFFNFDFNDNR